MTLNHSDWRKLYDSHWQTLVLFSDKVIKNTAAAEDIAGDAIEQAFYSLNAPQPPDDIIAFLYNKARDLCRIYNQDHKKMRLAIERRLPFTPSFDQQLIFSMQDAATVNQLYEKALALFSPQQQEIFKLKLKGYTDQEIADKIGTTIDVVRTSNSRIKNKLDEGGGDIRRYIVRHLFLALNYLLKVICQ